ncbi:hypothetical protein HWV62_24101 [Athelia sp. TMB]|nr:hypothetical protein HWV62_24101 [Athelia sp. TMB]
MSMPYSARFPKVLQCSVDHRPLRFNAAPVPRISIYFTGRNSELDLISKCLASSTGDEPARFAIYGMPGLGKSQLALQYSKLKYASQRYTYVFWIPATTVEKLSQGLTSVLDLVDDKDRHHPDQDVRLMAARRWLEKSPHSWLLILDNATLDSIPFLREHLPRENSRGALIITTRTHQVAEDIVDVGAHILELKALSVESSATLLINAAGLKESGDFDRKHVEKLVNQIGRLPLAVEQAGAYMKQKHIPANELQTLCDGMALDNVINWENSLGKYEKRSVLAAFGILLQDLHKVSPDARNLLSVLAFLDPENIPLDIVARGAERSKCRLAEQLASSGSPPEDSPAVRKKTAKPPPRKKRKVLDPGAKNAFSQESLLRLLCSKESLRGAMSYLEEYSLAQPVYGNSPSLHIHDLIQLVLLKESTRSQLEQECHTFAVTIITSAFETVGDSCTPQSWAECERFVPHLASLQSSYPAQTPPSREFMDMSQGIAKYFQKRGRYKDAEALLSRVLAQCERADGLGADHLDTLSMVHLLAGLYIEWGQHDRAETLCVRALAGREKHLGADHPKTLMALHHLALLRDRQDKYVEAESLFVRVLEGQEKTLGEEHLDTLETAENLANVHTIKGRHDLARQLYTRVLAGRERQLGTEHPDTLITVGNLGNVYRRQGKCKEAEVLYKRVLARNEKLLGAEHPETLIMVENFAFLREQQMRWAEAAELYERTLAGRKGVLGCRHPRTMRTLGYLADIYDIQGRDEEAQALRASARVAEADTKNVT